MEDIFERPASPQCRQPRHSRGASTFTQYEDQFDPHVWFDATLWRMAIDRSSKATRRTEPDGASEFEQHLREYKRQIDELHSFVERRISTIPEISRCWLRRTTPSILRLSVRHGGPGGCRVSAPSRTGSRDVRSSQTFDRERDQGHLRVNVPPETSRGSSGRHRTDKGWNLERSTGALRRRRRRGHRGRNLYWHVPREC